MARRSGGRRWLGALVVLLLILGGLFVAADRIAVGIAEQAIADAVQTSQDLPRSPETTVHGFPFLTQAVRGRYRRVDLAIDGIEAADGVTVDELNARLVGVRVPLRSALRREVERVPVDRATAVARISFAQLRAAATRQLESDGVQLAFAAAGPDRLRVTGRLATAAGAIELDTVARLAIRDGRLRVSVPQARLDDVPEPLRPQAAELLDLALDLPDLPLGFRPVAVSVDGDGVRLRAEGTDVVLPARS